MTQLSKHFSLNELKCKCKNNCIPIISPKLVEFLETLRELIGRPILVNSWFRCKQHNIAVGGSPNSKHCLGIAVDIVVKGMTITALYKHAEKILGETGGLINEYDRWLHIDLRLTKYREYKIK